MEALRNKLNEVIDIAGREKVNAVLHGGDLFDRPDLSPAVVRDFARLLRRLETPVYTIAGNHDIYGHNPETVDRSMLGLLDAFGTVRLIRAGEKICLEEGESVCNSPANPSTMIWIGGIRRWIMW